MFTEYDVIKAKRQLSDKVPEGILGTVLIVFKGEVPAYEVEFVDKGGNSLDILTVQASDIELNKSEQDKNSG